MHSGAEARGLRLRNRMLVQQLLVESDLDAILDPAEQQIWLDDPSHFASESRLVLDPEQVQRLRFRSQFERFRKEPVFEQVAGLLRTYVRTCVPAARRTELSFWSVTCLPSTNRSHHPRWAAVNIGEMEMLVLGWLPAEREPWAFVNVSRNALDMCAHDRLAGAGAMCELREYRAASGDCLAVATGANTFSAMDLILSDPDVVRAARRLSLQVMRKRPNWYAKYHCFDLADCVL